MLGYVGIYYLSGENIFVKEIAELGKIETLQSQLIIAGISGMLISLSIYYLEKTMTKETNVGNKKIGKYFFIFFSIKSVLAT